MDTFDVSHSHALDSDTLPTPPAVIHVPADMVRAPKRGRPAKVAPPAESLFTAVTGRKGAACAVIVHEDSDSALDVSVGNGQSALRVSYQGGNDRTLAVKLRARDNRASNFSDWLSDALKAPLAHNVTLDAAAVADALAHLNPAASTDVTRYALNSVFFDTSGTWVATDGHRLHSVTGLGSPFSVGVIVPRETMMTLEKALKATKADTVTIGRTLDGLYVTFRMAGPCLSIDLRSRLVDGQFPNYRSVIPSGENHQAFTGDADSVRSALKLAPVVGDRATGRDLVFSDGGAITFRHDRQAVALPIQGAEGETVSLKLNASYVEDALAELSGEVTVKVGDMEPVMITAGNKLALVMPMVR